MEKEVKRCHTKKAAMNYAGDKNALARIYKYVVYYRPTKKDPTRPWVVRQEYK